MRFPLGGGFRPQGLAQQISYQAGRMAGNAAKSSDNPDEGGNRCSTGGYDMNAWGRGPIYEPPDSRYRPNSVSALIFFFIGKFFGLLFKGTASLIGALISKLRRGK